MLVTGATGNQGGTVVDHLLESDTAFDVRGLTRNPDSDADIDALAETFGFEFTTLPEYLRAHGWVDKSEPASTPGWVKAI